MRFITIFMPLALEVEVVEEEVEDLIIAMESTLLHLLRLMIWGEGTGEGLRGGKRQGMERREILVVGVEKGEIQGMVLRDETVAIDGGGEEDWRIEAETETETGIGGETTVEIESWALVARALGDLLTVAIEGEELALTSVMKGVSLKTWGGGKERKTE